MEMIFRIAINSILIFLSLAVLCKASYLIFYPPKLPGVCTGRAMLQLRLIAIWDVIFLFMAWDWFIHGRMFIMPIQIELAWSAVIGFVILVFNEFIEMISACPMQRPIGDILCDIGVAKKEDIDRALEIQSDEKEKILMQ